VSLHMFISLRCTLTHFIFVYVQVDLFAELNGTGSRGGNAASSSTSSPSGGRPLGGSSSSALAARAMALWEDWKYTAYVFLPGAVLMYLYFKFSYVEEAI